MILDKQKTCSKCGETKSLCSFSEDNSRKDGHYPSCKACRLAYRIANRAKIAVKDKVYYNTNKIRIAAQSKDYRLKNNEKVLAKQAEYRRTNKVKIKEDSKKYYEKNKEVMLEKGAEYYTSHREAIIADTKRYSKTEKGKKVKKQAQSRYYIANKEKIQLYHQEHDKTKQGRIVRLRAGHKRRALKVNAPVVEVFNPIEVLERDDYICQSCGKKTRPDYKCTHPLYPNCDHIVPLAEGGNHTMLNTQCLCHQCNMEKGHTGKGDQLRMFE